MGYILTQNKNLNSTRRATETLKDTQCQSGLTKTETISQCPDIEKGLTTTRHYHT